jgi:TorA maturation chaperone TorD
VLGDRELLDFRRGYYDLLTSLLGAEPPAALLDRLRDGLRERVQAARQLDPALAHGWELLGDYLARQPRGTAAAAADEFTRLFIGPGVPPLHLYESYYLTGRLLERPLALVRGFLASAGLEKDPAQTEPEDWLPCELAAMRRLITRQLEAPDPDDATRWVDAQTRFLTQHLLVWGPRCADDLAEAKGADLYRAVGRLLRGFLELERELVREWDPAPVLTLEQARAAASAAAVWRGPIFELPASPDAGSEAPPPAR